MSRLEKYMMNEIALPSWIIRLFDGIKSELAKMTFNEFEKKCAKSFHDIINDKDLRKNEKAWNGIWQTALEFPIQNDPGIRPMYNAYIQDLENMKTEKYKRNVKAMNQYFGMSEEQVNEDVAHLWKLVKNEAFPTLAFYPALQVWLEFDKMLKGTPYSGKVIVFYAAFWLILMSGKHIAQWNKWRKENPEQYKAEREVGGGRVI